MVTEPWPQTTCTVILVKFRLAVPEIWVWKNRQTCRNTLHNYMDLNLGLTEIVTA